MTGSGSVTASVSVWFEETTKEVGISTTDPASAIDYEAGHLLDFYEVIEDSVSNIALLGNVEDRRAAVTELVDSYRTTFHEGVVDRMRSSEELLATSKELDREVYGFNLFHRRDSPAVRLVVIEAEDFVYEKETSDLLGAALRNIVANGPASGWGSILSTVGSYPAVGTERRPAARTVWALGPLTWDRATGLPREAIAAAVRGGVGTAEGIREVIAGAPVEWVRAWETSTARVETVLS